MNKYFKYSFLSLFAALSLVSCDNEYEYEAAVPESEINAENNQVYFPIDSIREEYTLDGSKNSLELIVCRIDTIAEKTIRIEAEGDSLVSVPETLTFAAGEAKATLNIAYNAETLGYDNPQTVTLWIADSTQTTIYGMSKYQFKINLPAPWISLGMGKIADAFIAGDFYDAEIQQNKLEPNKYRVVNPYDEMLVAEDYPMNAGPAKYLEFEVLEAGSSLGSYTFNSECVYFSPMQVGYYYDDGTYTGEVFAYHPAHFNGLCTAEQMCQYNRVVVYNETENGKIPAHVIMAPLYYIPSAGVNFNASTTTTEGMIEVLFPGYVKADYSAEVQYAGIFTAANDTVYAVGNLTLGADATDVKAIVMPQDADASAVADAIAAGELEAVEVETGRIEVPFDAEELATDKFQIVVVVLANGELKTVATTPFEYYGGGANPWQSIGTGYFTDDIIAPLVKVAPPTYEVEILANEEQPGIYRVMNPYSNSVYPLAEDDAAPEGLYLEVNAMDPNAVYVQYQTLGFDWGVGEFGFATVAADLLLTQGIPIETIKEKGYGGTLADGVIKFPLLSNSSGAKFQGYVYGAGELINYAGMNGKFEITLPSANAFAKNMAKARTKVSSLEVQKGSLSAVNVEKVFSKTLLRKPIAIDIQK